MSLSTSRIVSGEQDLVVLPRNGGKGKRLIMVAHGANGSPQQYASASNIGSWKILNALSAAGYAMIVSEWGGTQNWGNDTVLTRFDSYLAWAVTNLPGVLTDKVFMWGGSMGNWTSLRCAADRPTKVAAVASMIPLCDIQDIHVSDKLGSRAFIDTAWSITYPTPVPARGDLLARAQAGDLAGLPWRGYNGSADTVCPPSTVTAMVAAIGASASSTVVNTTDDHSDNIIQNIDVNDMISFFAAHA